ncbi:MAG: TIGR02099 family protein, partial [Ramlibacter sp.]
MNDSPPSPSRLLKAYAAVAKGSLWLLLAGWVVLVLAWGALHGWIVPRIGELRPDLEIEAGRVLGVPVRIGSITARSEGLFPSFELQDVELLDPQGRPALRLPRVLAALSPRSLWNLGFEQLYIDSPELDVRRARDGRVFIAGLDFAGADVSGDSRAADWFFRQTEFVIRNGTVRWTDEMRDAPPLALSQVEFVMRNSVRRHAMRLEATPPAEWGDRFSLRGLFRQPLLTVHDGRWQNWDGQLHGDFSRVDVTRLRRYANLGVEVGEGHGAVRAWADIEHGQITGGVAALLLADVSATLGRQLQPLALRSISGRIGGKLLVAGFEVQTQDLQFETREGQRWPGGNLFLRWTDADGRHPAQGELRADKLDL